MNVNKIIITSLIYLVTLLFSYTKFYSQVITAPTIQNYGINLDFDQIDDTITISSFAPWDFSSINASLTYSMSVMPISSSQYASDYPNASHVLMSDNGEFYMGIDSLKATSYGRRTTGGTITNYSNPLTLLTFPFDETISHTHGITSTVLWNNFNAPVSDNFQITGISMGMLTMPDGTVHNEAVLVDAIRTTNNGPLFGQYLNIQEISKQFWVSGYPYPVVEILHAYSNSSLVLKRSLFLKGTPAFKNDNLIHEISIYPNPVKDYLTINSINNSDVFKTKIYDLMGSLIEVSNKKIIDIENYPSGIYILKIISKNKIQDFKVIKE